MSVIEKLKYAFAVHTEEAELTEEEKNLLLKLADAVVKRRLGVIATTFLESVKYLNFIGSQAMVFFEPIVQTIFPNDTYGKIHKLLEKRHSVEYLITKIEDLEDVKNTKVIK